MPDHRTPGGGWVPPRTHTDEWHVNGHHADETSWSLNSVWAFLSEKARVLFFGVHKDANTLKQVLDPATFAGTVISDDAAVYRNFTRAQKCWAHLLRKAIKLTLHDPTNPDYRRFADRLLEIYRGRVVCSETGDSATLGEPGRSPPSTTRSSRCVNPCGVRVRRRSRSRTGIIGG